MASAVQEVFGYFPSASTDNATQLSRRPCGGNVPAGSVITVEIAFTSAGGSEGLGIEKWLMGVRYSAKNVPSTAAGDRSASRITYSGGFLLSEAYVYGGGDTRLYLRWRPVDSGRNWTLRGHLWVETSD